MVLRNTYWLFFLFIIGACSHVPRHAYISEDLPSRTESQLLVYADTSRTLNRISELPNNRQRVDSLICYAEWLENYEEDVALYYAQQAYDLATERNWNFPRAVAAYQDCFNQRTQISIWGRL